MAPSWTGSHIDYEASSVATFAGADYVFPVNYSGRRKTPAMAAVETGASGRSLVSYRLRGSVLKSQLLWQEWGPRRSRW